MLTGIEPIESLPNDLLAKILSDLPLEEILENRLVNKQFNNAIDKPFFVASNNLSLFPLFA